MTEAQPVEATPATPAAEAPPAESPVPAPTAEQVEAEYKARLSGKDKAHSAEVASLRSQLEAANGTAATAQTQADGTLSEVDALKQQLAESQKTNKQQAAEYTGTLRATQYPYAAEALDAPSLAAMDEAKLAGLNARLAPARPGIPVDPSTPARTAEAPKPTGEKTKAELQADLRAMSPQFAQEIRDR